MLNALNDLAGRPQVTVYVPPKEQPPRDPEFFQPGAFRLPEAGDELTCPNQETTRTPHRDRLDHGWQLRFRPSQCRDCPLRAQCIAPGNNQGRKVSKNDFQAQCEAARERARTDEYNRIRKEHPRIERKLNELVRWHDGRRVRYRGHPRAKVQYLLLAVGDNCKRIVS